MGELEGGVADGVISEHTDRQDELRTKWTLAAAWPSPVCEWSR